MKNYQKLSENFFNFLRKNDEELTSVSDEEFMNEEDYELTGSIVIIKDEYEDNQYSFYCGPEIKYECISDCIYLDSYLAEKVEKFDNFFDIGAAENFHILEVSDENKGLDILKSLKEDIESDGFNVVMVDFE